MTTEDYRATTKDIFLFGLLVLVFLAGLVLDGKYGCEPHDPKPECNYQISQN